MSSPGMRGCGLHIRHSDKLRLAEARCGKVDRGRHGERPRHGAEVGDRVHGGRSQGEDAPEPALRRDGDPIDGAELLPGKAPRYDVGEVKGEVDPGVAEERGEGELDVEGGAGDLGVGRAEHESPLVTAAVRYVQLYAERVVGRDAHLEHQEGLHQRDGLELRSGRGHRDQRQEAK